MESFVQLPALPLRSCIAHYAGGRASGLPGGGVHAGLPSRHAHLIISLAGPFEVLGMPDPRQRPDKFQAPVSGLQDAPAFVTDSTHIDLLHLFLKPLGVRALFGVPCAALSNRVVALSDLWGDAASAILLERLHEAGSWQARCAVLDDEFLRRLNPISTRREVSWAWHQLMQTRGNIQDQAHMTHEWKALAGMTPRVWLANELPFLQDYELASGDDERPLAQSRR